jgi:hypothetical protein
MSVPILPVALLYATKWLRNGRPWVVDTVSTCARAGGAGACGAHHLYQVVAFLLR